MIKYRGKGVAKLLMSKAEELALERGYSSVRIDTNEKNIAMNSLFQLLGYKYCGTISFNDQPDKYKHLKFNCYIKSIMK